MAGKRIGYARVSTQEQNLDRQLDNLKAQGCEPIYQDKITGTKASRPALDQMMQALREGDTLVIDSFSRLSRSTKDLLDMVERLQAMGVQLVSLKEKLDTTTATGKMMLTMLSALSQFERDIIAERTKEGLKAAKARGRNGGRPKADEAKVQRALELHALDKYSIKEISELTGVSTATINRRIAEQKAAIESKA
ncbi:MAG: recombinase family protein [Oscillospiraceae bacterium]|nr:recombinase family protein [Oscillospiraceae bacterium]